ARLAQQAAPGSTVGTGPWPGPAQQAGDLRVGGPCRGAAGTRPGRGRRRSEMRKVGIYYAFWTHEWEADFLPFVPKVKELGFDQLEVNGGTIAEMKPADRATLAGAAREAGLRLSYGIGLPAQYDV